MRVERTNGNGFSIIETAVVAAIITILVGLIVVALPGVRERSRESKNLANLRTHASTWSAYTVDYKDVFPFFVPVDPGSVEVPTPAGPQTVSYFRQRSRWPLFMSEAWYSGVRKDDPMFRPPWAKDPAYAYFSPCAFRVDPLFYSLAWTPPPTQFRAIRSSEVAVPASKGFFTDRGIVYNSSGEPVQLTGGPFSAAMVDGHARRVQAREVINNSQLGEARQGYLSWKDSCINNDFGHMSHTEMGVQGRDLR